MSAPPTDKSSERKRRNAESAARRRQRAKDGLRRETVLVGPGQFAAVLDQGATADALCELGLLAEWDAEDKAKVQAAMLRWLVDLARHR